MNTAFEKRKNCNLNLTTMVSVVDIGETREGKWKWINEHRILFQQIMTFITVFCPLLKDESLGLIFLSVVLLYRYILQGDKFCLIFREWHCMSSWLVILFLLSESWHCMSFVMKLRLIPFIGGRMSWYLVMWGSPLPEK